MAFDMETMLKIAIKAMDIEPLSGYYGGSGSGGAGLITIERVK